MKEKERGKNRSDRKTRYKQLQNDLNEKTGYWQLKEETLHYTLWKTCCKTDYRVNEGTTYIEEEHKH